MSNGIDISIREATAADWPAIVACQAKLEERLGVPAGSLDLPEIEIPDPRDPDGKKMMRNPAVFYWVAERDGQVVEALYLELCIEWNLVGTDPEALHEITEFRETVFELASKAGARFLHAFVQPGPWEKANGRHLEHARLFPTGLIHYRRSIIADRPIGANQR